MRVTIEAPELFNTDYEDGLSHKIKSVMAACGELRDGLCLSKLSHTTYHSIIAHAVCFPALISPFGSFSEVPVVKTAVCYENNCTFHYNCM